MAPTVQPRSSSAYFRLTHPLVMAVILIFNAYHAWILFAPGTVPTRYLGPLGTLTEYLVEHHRIYLAIGCAIIWLLHFIYTGIALKLCKDKGITDRTALIQWTVQTIFFGLASLFLLLIYEPPPKKRQ